MFMKIIHQCSLTPCIPVLLLTMILIWTGCSDSVDYRPRATGPEGKILVVMDTNSWKGDVGLAIQEALGSYISTLPAPEPSFDLQQVSLISEAVLDNVRKQKNVVFVAPLSDSTSEARFIRNRLDEQSITTLEEGRGAVIPRENLWRKDQLVYYITGGNPEDIISAVEQNREDLRFAFNQVTRQRMEVSMFDKGRQPEIEDYLLENHGFTVKAQHDFYVAMDTMNFVWLRRRISTESWRSLFIHYEENGNPSDLSAEWILNTRDSLTQKYIRGEVMGYMEIDRRRPFMVENINFLDRYAYEGRGLWQMMAMDGGQEVQLGMGGAFLSYAFYDEGSGRNYLIDGAVFAPGFNKREFLRQMEVIAHTFTTREDQQTLVAESTTP